MKKVAIVTQPSLINHFNQNFSNFVSNYDSQSIDENMVKLKGPSSMMHYVKNNTIKWGFNFWHYCGSEAGYLYQFDLYLCKNERAKENLGPGVFLKMTESFQNSHLFFFLFFVVVVVVFLFINFFNSPVPHL